MIWDAVVMDKWWDNFEKNGESGSTDNDDFEMETRGVWVWWAENVVISVKESWRLGVECVGERLTCLFE